MVIFDHVGYKKACPRYTQAYVFGQGGCAQVGRIQQSSSMKPRLLTKREKDTYEAVRAHWTLKGYGPTLRELGDQLGIRKVCAWEYVRNCRDKGWLAGQKQKSRSIVPIVGKCPCCGKRMK